MYLMDLFFQEFLVCLKSFHIVSCDSYYSWYNTVIYCHYVTSSLAPNITLRIVRFQPTEHSSTRSGLSRDYPVGFNELWLNLGHSHTVTLIQKDIYEEGSSAQISQSKNIPNSLSVLMV